MFLPFRPSSQKHLPKTADLLHKPHPSESKFDPPMTWISLNAGLPSQIPNLPRTEDRLSVSPKEATDLRDFLAELDQFPVNCAKEEAVAHFFWYMHTSSCQLLCQPGHLTEHASAQQVEEMENSEATNKTIILPYLTHDFA